MGARDERAARYLVQPRTDIRAHDEFDAFDFGLHEHDPRVLCLGRVRIPAQCLDRIRLQKEYARSLTILTATHTRRNGNLRTCLRMWSRRAPRTSACTGSMSGACRSLSQCRMSGWKSVSRGAPKSSAMGPEVDADPVGAPAMGKSSPSSRSVRRGGIAAQRSPAKGEKVSIRPLS